MSPEKRIKVLHIITNLAVGGAQDNVLLTIEKLDRAKYDVSLLTSSEGEWLERTKNIKNLHLIFVDSFTRMIHPLKDLLTLCKVYSRIKDGEYDIVHTHSSKAGVLGRVAAGLAGVPIIVHSHHGLNFHDYLNPVLRFMFLKLERWLSRISTKLIIVSSSNLQKVLDVKLAPPHKLAKIYYGINFEDFNVRIDAKAKRNEIGIFGKQQIVGTVGRLCPQKAPQDLIRAIPKVIAANKDVIFIFIGGGQLLPKMRSLSRKLGVDSHVRFLGDREDIPELLRMMDLFVLTSLWEGMPRALIEAMYCARPVVATAVDGTPELLRNGMFGILAPPKDVEQIASGIITLLKDRERAEQMGQAARNHAANLFSIEKMLTEIEKLYDDLLHQKGLDRKISSNKDAEKTRKNTSTTF